MMSPGRNVNEEEIMSALSPSAGMRMGHSPVRWALVIAFGLCLGYAGDRLAGALIEYLLVPPIRVLFPGNASTLTIGFWRLRFPIGLLLGAMVDFTLRVVLFVAAARWIAAKVPAFGSRPCPACRESIHPEATRCPFCTTPVQPDSTGRPDAASSS